MNLQQPSKPSANGFGRRRGDRDLGSRVDNKFHSGKSNANKLTNSSAIPGEESVVCDSPSHDRLIYLATCLIGHHVEVQVKNGSKYTGIFHATNAEKDFGIILKMAHLSKDATLRGKKFAESLNKAPSKTLIIPAEELVQVLAKDVSITRDGLMNDIRHEKLHELMLDSSISQSCHVEVERELKPWVPDEDDPQYPELDNIFDDPWNRNWDQFERNETLFGVKSTYDEELYTTKLEKGPQMKALETEALRIAKEIEGEDTQDLHLAEERGIDLHSKLDIDEETRFSSVGRGVVVDDGGYEEDTDIFLDSHNMETFGESFHSEAKGSTDLTFGKGNDRDGPSSISSSLDHAQFSECKIVVDVCRSSSEENARQVASDPTLRSFPTLESENRIPENPPDGRKSASELTEQHRQDAGDNQLTKPKDFQSSDGVPDKGLFTNISFGANVSLTNNEKYTSTTSPSESSLYSKQNGETQTASSRLRPGSSASSNSDGAAAASVSGHPGLSPSSSVGSLASEKSTLNPYAKEFKLNPNAKSFVPSQTPIRPQSPGSDGAFYYQNNMPAAVPHIHGMPFGVGVGPGFAGHHQPVIFNPPVAPMLPPQAYFQPNVHQYGQQMLLDQPRQLVYMQGYQPWQEMPYKGRE